MKKKTLLILFALAATLLATSCHSCYNGRVKWKNDSFAPTSQNMNAPSPITNFSIRNMS